jgi:hypothetical protein
MLGGLAGLLLVSLILSLGVGAVALPPGQVVAALWAKLGGSAPVAPTTLTIVWDLRLARALLNVASPPEIRQAACRIHDMGPQWVLGGAPGNAEHAWHRLAVPWLQPLRPDWHGAILYRGPSRWPKTT